MGVTRVAVAVVIVAGLAGLALMVSANHGDGHAHRHGGREMGTLWTAATPEERAAAANLLVATRTGLQRFRDVGVAMREGYYQPRAGAAHYRNDAYLADGVALDPERPESLVYWTGRNGEQVLAGAAFKALPGQAVPSLGGPLTPWHAHPTPDTVCQVATDPGCAGHLRMLHVFVFDGAVDPFALSMAEAAGGKAALEAAMGSWAGAMRAWAGDVNL